MEIQVIETEMADWSHINEKVEQSKIFRIPYKKILGETLTSYAIRLQKEGYTIQSAFAKVINHPEMMIYLMKHKEMGEKIMDNIETSIKARFSEEHTRGR